MSVKIKKLTGEIFDLPPDYIIESEKTNPLFSTKGSQTVSISFQNSGNNLLLTDYANRPDKYDKPSKAFKVVVESGSSQQSGLMAINSASDKSVSANIGWDESEMYASMGETMLKDLPVMPSYDPGVDDQREKMEVMLSHITSVMNEEIDADYYVFPLCLKKETEGTTVYMEILNEFEISSTDPAGSMGKLLARNNRVIKRYMDGEEVSFNVPIGYGVSPFLKVGKLLEIIFDNYELSIEANPFREHRQLKRLVVLNNTMDTILTGLLNYKDLMPDITVKDFFEALYKKFGLKYFVDSNRKTVTLQFIKDFLTPTQQAKDFSRYKTAPLSISYTAHKQIKLIENREIEGTETKYTTFDEFLKKYEYQFIDSDDPRLNFSYTAIFNSIYRIYSVKDVNGNFQDVSSDFFDYDKKYDLPYEEIKMDDLALPLHVGECSMLLYLVGYKHVYSSTSVSGETIESEQSSAKLAFAFGWGKTSEENLPNYFFASQDNRNEKGEFIYDENGIKYDLSLTIHREDGLFNRFWKEYDAFLRHSNYIATAKLKLPELEIFNLKMFQTVFIDNQPYLPEQIKFNLNKPDSVSEFKLRTLRLYQPYNLEEEQKITAYHPQEYYWRMDIQKDSDIEERLISQGISFSYEGGTPFSTQGKSIIWPPPSKYEYENNRTKIYTYDYVVVYFLFQQYKVPVHQVVTYYPTPVQS